MDYAIGLTCCFSATQAQVERTGAGPSLPAVVAFVSVNHDLILARGSDIFGLKTP